MKKRHILWQGIFVHRLQRPSWWESMVVYEYSWWL